MAFSQAHQTIQHFHSHPVCSLSLTMDHSATWERSGSVVGFVDTSIPKYNGRCTLAARCSSGRGGERSDARERTARLSAEADVPSLRAQVTPTGVPPTVDHHALADSVACCGTVSVTNRTFGQPCFLEVGQVSAGANSLARLGSNTTELHVECECRHAHRDDCDRG